MVNFGFINNLRLSAPTPNVMSSVGGTVTPVRVINTMLTAQDIKDYYQGDLYLLLNEDVVLGSIIFADLKAPIRNENKGGLNVARPLFPYTKNIPLKTISLYEVLATSDYITVHVPRGSLIDKSEIAQMKNGVCLINTSRGGVINEVALIEGLNSGKIAHAALDVFENEPTPKTELLSHPKISLTPHIGAATDEAQERIGLELATIIVSFFKE